MLKKQTTQRQRSQPAIIHPVEEGVVPGESTLLITTPGDAARRHLLYPLRIGHFTYAPGFHLMRNRFDSFLFGIVTEGSQHVTIWNDDGERHYQVDVGHGFLFDTYRPHEAWTDTVTRTGMIHFDGAAARLYYDNVVNVLGNVFPLSNEAFMRNSVDLLLKAYAERPKDDPRRDLFGARILTDMLTDLSLLPDAKAADDLLAVRETTAYIAAHFAEDITVEALARRAMMSPRHYTRRFREATGHTPHAYVTALRMDKAKSLLLGGDMTVAQVAKAVGYPTPAAFSAAFKRHLAMTPQQYRAQSADEPKAGASDKSLTNRSLALAQDDGMDTRTPQRPHSGR